VAYGCASAHLCNIYNVVTVPMEHALAPLLDATNGLPVMPYIARTMESAGGRRHDEGKVAGIDRADPIAVEVGGLLHSVG